MPTDLLAMPDVADGVPLVTPAAGAERAAARRTAAGGDTAAADEALAVLHEQAQRNGSGDTPPPDEASGPAVVKRQPGPAARLLLLIAALAALAAVAVTLYAVIAHPSGLLSHSFALPGRLGALPAWVTVAAVLGALTTAAIALRGLLRAVRDTPVEDVLTVVVAALVTAVALNGMWRFFGNILDFAAPLRVLVFGVLEGGTITCALRARRTIRGHIARIEAGQVSPGEPPSAGADGLMMWAFTGLSAVLSSLDAGSLPAAVARLAMPLLAAWLWDRSLRLEHRRATGRKINWSVTPERVLVWAHLAEPTNRSTEEVDEHRYIARVAQACCAYQSLLDGDAGAWRARRAFRVLEKRLAAADGHTKVATDAGLQEELLQRIAARRGAQSLAAAEAPAPWAGRVAVGGSDGGAGRTALPPPPRPRRRRQGPPADGLTFTELAGQLAQARADADHGLVHELLAGRDDYAGFTRWLATSGQGTKRLMAVVALYATGAPASHATSPNWVATAHRWIMQQVPGDAGKVDKSDIRAEARKLTAVWAAEAAASDPGADDGTKEKSQ